MIFPEYDCNDYSHLIKKGDNFVDPGTDIITLKAYVHFLFPKFSGSRCENCFKCPVKDRIQLEKCTGCGKVAFCGKKCQEMCYLSFHKYECAQFIGKKLPEENTRILLRILLKLKKQKDEGEPCYELVGRYKLRFRDLHSKFDDLISHEERDKAVREVLWHKVQLMKYYPSVKLPSDAQLMSIFGRVLSNTIYLQNSSTENIGVGIFFGVSLFEHSCCPNAILNSRSTTMVVRSITHIPVKLPLSKLTVASGLKMLPSGLREKTARLQFGDCNCDHCCLKENNETMCKIYCPSNKCSKTVLLQNKSCTYCEEPLEDEFIKNCNQLEKFCTKYIEEACMQRLEHHPDQYVRIFESCLEKLEANGYFIDHWLVVNVALMIFDGHYSESRWQQAYASGKIILNAYKRYFSKFHPQTGLHLLKMFDICFNLRMYGEAKVHISEGTENIKTGYGNNSIFFLNEIHNRRRMMNSVSKKSIRQKMFRKV